jgi:2-(1,2-epoxy-1,2-dihydrophenyl)acetyl-CoA isomerase
MPVVAAVHGPAVGIGCSLALASDLIVAASSTLFVLAFVHVGLISDGGATAFLPARVGMARATELAFLGEKLPARQALDWGLINRVFADNELHEEARKLAAKLSAGPTLAYANVKRAYNFYAYRSLQEHLNLESELQQQQAESRYFEEAVQAYRQKRTSESTGR